MPEPAQLTTREAKFGIDEALIANQRALTALNNAAALVPSGPLGAIQFSSGANTFASDDANLHFNNALNRLGIGTNIPSTTLEVAGGTLITGRFDVTTNAPLVFASVIQNTADAADANGLAVVAGTTLAGTSTLFQIGTPATEVLRFIQSGTNAIDIIPTVDNVSTVGTNLLRFSLVRATVGTFGSSAATALNATISSAVATVFIGSFINSGAANGSSGVLIRAGSDAGVGALIMQFQRPDATVIGTITQDGAATVAYGTASDRRLKSDIIDYNNDYNLINKIRVREFTYKSDPTKDKKKYVGFIAQELYEVWPHAVVPGDIWNIDYAKLTPLLVKSIQDLHSKIEELEKKMK